MNAEHTELILKQVFAERERQFKKWGVQDLPIVDERRKFAFKCNVNNMQLETDKKLKNGTVTFLDIMDEELYEAFAESDIDKQREEFIQVAAVAVQIIEYIDRMEGKK